LNEAELKNIAEKGNGIYQLFTSTDDVVANLVNRLQGMEQRTVTENSLVNYQNYFPWFLAAALLLIFIESFVSEIKNTATKIKVGINKVAILIVFIFSSTKVIAQNDNALLNKGNEAYKKKQFDIAAANYEKAISKNPGNVKAQYNLGSAFYKSGKAEDALKAYNMALQKSRSVNDKADTWYNKGVVLQNNKKLPECIEAYKNALRLDPADEDARLNLQKALQQRKQQQEKKDKEKKQPKEDQNKKEQEQPKPQSSKMSKQDAEEKLKALLQQEKNLQEKLRKVNAASPDKPEKDW